MFDYLLKSGVALESEVVKLPEINPEILQAAKDLTAAVESMTDEQFDKVLGEIQKEHIKWIDSDSDNYYAALESVDIEYGLESAYNQNRNMLKSALIRLRMAFGIWDDNKATADYVSVLKNIDASNVSQTTSNVVLSKANVDAYLKAMNFIASTQIVNDRELERSIREIANTINSKVSKIIIAMFMSVIPVVQFMSLAYLMYTLIKLPQMAEEMKEKYGEDLKKHLVSAIQRSGLDKEVGATVDSTGKFDTSSLTKIANGIVNMKATMMPSKVRSQVSRPNFLKSKVSVTYDEKVAIVNAVKGQSETILRTVGDTPLRFNNAMRFALSSDQVTQNMQEGYQYGIMSEDSLYSALCENIIALGVDALTVSCLLVVDLKKY